MKDRSVIFLLRQTWFATIRAVRPNATSFHLRHA
jgi:hypothetical protein